MEFAEELGKGERTVCCPKFFLCAPVKPSLQQASGITPALTSFLRLNQLRATKTMEARGSMNQSPIQTIPLHSVGCQDVPQPPMPATPIASSHSRVKSEAPRGPPPWGLSCLLALQVGGLRGAELAQTGCWPRDWQETWAW